MTMLRLSMGRRRVVVRPAVRIEIEQTTINRADFEKASGHQSALSTTSLTCTSDKYFAFPTRYSRLTTIETLTRFSQAQKGLISTEPASNGECFVQVRPTPPETELKARPRDTAS